MRRTVVIFVVLVAVAGVSWFGLRRYKCQQRNAAFGREIETIKQDARARIKIGTAKTDVARFFTEHNIPFTIVGSKVLGAPEAFGTLYTSGCAPLGCGSDAALIGVRVKLDEAGTAIKEPEVVGLYTNCL